MNRQNIDEMLKLSGKLGGVKKAFLLSFFVATNGVNDTWFNCTRDVIGSVTGLSRWEQEKAREQLKEEGYLEEKFECIPRKLFIRLTDKAIDLLNSIIEKEQTYAAYPVNVAVDVGIQEAVVYSVLIDMMIKADLKEIATTYGEIASQKEELTERRVRTAIENLLKMKYIGLRNANGARYYSILK